MRERNLLDIFRIFYRRKFIILLIIISSLLTAAILSITLPPIYEAEVSLFPSSSRAGAQYSLGLSAFGDTSSYVLTSAPNKQMLRSHVGILSSNSVAQYVADSIPEKSLRQIKKSAKFDITKNGLLRIVILDEDPVLVAKIANTFAESFNRFLQSISSQEARKIRIFSEEQLQSAHDRLVAAEEKLKIFKEAHRISAIDEEISRLVEEDAKLEAERRLLAVDIQQNEIELNSTEKLLAQQSKMQRYSEIMADNPILRKLKSDLVDLEVQLAGVKSNYGDFHARTLSLNTQIEEAKNKMKSEVEKLVVSETSRIDPLYEELTQKFVVLQVTKNALQARKEALDVIIQQVEKLLLQTPERSQEYARLVRDMTQAEEIHKMMALKVQDAKMEEASESEDIVVVDAASVPEEPAFPKLTYNLLASLGFSIIISIFLCFLLEHIEESRRSDPSQRPQIREP